MRLNTFILALTLAVSVQVLAEEVTLGVWHKLSDHESFEKRGEIRVDIDEWLSLNQQRDQPTASSTQGSKQRQQQQQEQQQRQQQGQQKKSLFVYENAQLSANEAASLAEDFVLNVQAPIKVKELEEPQPRDVDENGNFVESEEDFEQRMEEWKMQQEERDAQGEILQTPGSYGFYQIKLKDESRGWEAMSSIKSCLLLASDFQEEITLHLDRDNQIFAFDYYTTESKCESDHKNEFALTSLDRFKSVKVDLIGSASGPKAHYVRAQAMKVDQTGQPETEKTFFQKYWVYIVPIVLVMLFTGGEPEKTAA
ncbi:hypothetical protein BC939DRAFT_446310 [Gamsiella multidivaricata]|uniref:uncharacterized protein n=1 Tax=Gamsiella multidivaricata TaxID=101098 RepID=UPI0022211B26|nr:uncharacterized protein BC939DRAFT_446310 [Gamsiella multidivaricata]KAG0369493.1 ER membrane protein complex subunit 10 [Gamsiella multidivaricata]KAI7826951.1 hypothetical protein BC939DRAFT_446310 [Gamsiella multidivaricata]